MRNFFKSLTFKIIMGIFLVLAGLMAYSAATPGSATMPEKFITLITVPFQKLFSGVSFSVSSFFGNIANAGEIAAENEELENEVNELRERLIDFETYKAENEQLRELLELKEENPDFVMLSASVVGRDTDDFGTSITIDKGSLHGVALRDTIVTKAGLVGVVTEVYPTSAKVITVLDGGLQIGAQILRTRDTCVASGDVELALRKMLRVSYIPRESQAAKGDFIVTSGVSGLYPKNLLIGVVDDIKSELSGVALYATVTPAVDIGSVRNVFIIRDFFGKDSSATENKADQ